MTARPRIRAVRTERSEPVLVNAGESRSVVGSETDTIARAMSILIGYQRDGLIHDCRNIPYTQARDVVAWAG